MPRTEQAVHDLLNLEPGSCMRSFALNDRNFITPIHFGYGLRLGEPPPGDPVAWLDRQLDTAAPLPPGVTSAEAVQAPVATVNQRQARDRAEAAGSGMAGDMQPGMTQADAPGRTPLARVTRAELTA
jgi:hypothetical protein